MHNLTLLAFLVYLKEILDYMLIQYWEDWEKIRQWFFQSSGCPVLAWLERNPTWFSAVVVHVRLRSIVRYGWVCLTDPKPDVF